MNSLLVLKIFAVLISLQVVSCRLPEDTLERKHLCRWCKHSGAEADALLYSQQVIKSHFVTYQNPCLALVEK